MEDTEEWKINPVMAKRVKTLIESEKFPYEIYPRIRYDPYIYIFDRKKNKFVKGEEYQKTGEFIEPDMKSDGVIYFSKTQNKINKHGKKIKYKYETQFFSKESIGTGVNEKEEFLFTFPDDSSLLLVKDGVYLIRDNPNKYLIWKDNKIVETVNINPSSHTVKLNDTTILEIRNEDGILFYRFHYFIKGTIQSSDEHELHTESYIERINDLEAMNSELVIVVTDREVLSLDFSELKMDIQEEPKVNIFGELEMDIQEGPKVNIILKLNSPASKEYHGIARRIGENFFILSFNNELNLYWCNGKSSYLVQTISEKDLQSFPHLLPPDKEELKRIGDLLELNISDDLKGVIVNYLISDYNDTIK